MTTAHKQLARLESSPYGNTYANIAAVLVKRLRNWIFNRSTRRQLLTIDERLLQDVALDKEEGIHLERARFRR